MPIVIDNWSIIVESNIHKYLHGTISNTVGCCSSKIVNITNKLVTTITGTVFELGTVNPNFMSNHPEVLVDIGLNELDNRARVEIKKKLPKD